MKTRVHYRDPQGQLTFKDVVAPKKDAKAVFNHTFPGCQVQRVEQIGGERVSTAHSKPAAPYALAPGDRAITDQERQGHIDQMKALRAEIRQLPAPVSRAGRVGLSVEQRDRGAFRKK